MTLSDRKVILELSEHDTMRLLILIESELNKGDKVWRGYWERLAHQVKNAIEQAGSGPLLDPGSLVDPDNG
jgi:hypothetical protein